MVLRRRALLGGLLAGLLLAPACLPKRPAPVAAPNETATSLVAVLQRLDGAGPEAVPPELFERLSEELALRNLKMADGSSEALGAFKARQASPQRLAWMQEQSGAGELLVLVATQVEFYSQMNGRWRWTVSVELSVAPKGDLAQTVSSSFSVPVFMQFHHQQEPEALVEAGPVIQRELGYLLDQVLGGMQ